MDKPHAMKEQKHKSSKSASPNASSPCDTSSIPYQNNDMIEDYSDQATCSNGINRTHNIGFTESSCPKPDSTNIFGGSTDQNLQDQIAKREMRNDDIILNKLKNGCDQKRLGKDRTSDLHNQLENMHLCTITATINEVPSPKNILGAMSGLLANNDDSSIVKASPEDFRNEANISMLMPSIVKPNQHDSTASVVLADKEPVILTSDKDSAQGELNALEQTGAAVETKGINESRSTDMSNVELQKIFKKKENDFGLNTSNKDCPSRPSDGIKYFVATESGDICSGSLDKIYLPSIDTDSTEFVALTKSLQRADASSNLQSIESRPIYPNVPYSPYASPYGSPRSNRRRPPLRESRRISIEQSGSFLQLNQYKLMDQIGQGSYGLVKLAYSEEDSTHYAMKILSKRRLLRQAGLMRRGPKKTTSPLDRVYREIAVLKKLDHPNVVKLIEVLDDPVEDSLYMVFELVKQGEVLRIPTAKPLSEERAWSIFRESLLGLEYLHYQRIIHADLKPGNLLLTECGHIKIADLGVCNEFFGEDATMSNGSTAGTPAFRAPETLNLEKRSYCGRAADIWALGATLYSLVYGNVPFIANSVPVLYEKIKNDPLVFPDARNISDELRDCIQRMLMKNPEERIGLQQLKEHSWVIGGGVYPLPTEDENCRLVQVNEDDINSVVRSIPKLDTLILIKTMLKKHSFGNPFLKGISGRAPQLGGSRLEQFVRAGRSNSAPGAYNSSIDRQLSGDNVLPSLSEIPPSSNYEE